MTSDGSSSTETNEFTPPNWDPEVSSHSDSHDSENQPGGAATLMETGTSDLEENDGDQGSDTNHEERRITTKTVERSPKIDRQEFQTASNSTDADTDYNTISGCHLVECTAANRKRCEKTERTQSRPPIKRRRKSDSSSHAQFKYVHQGARAWRGATEPTSERYRKSSPARVILKEAPSAKNRTNPSHSSHAVGQRGDAAEANLRARSKEKQEDNSRVCSAKTTDRKPTHDRSGATDHKARDHYRLPSTPRTTRKPIVPDKRMDNGRSSHVKCERSGAIQRCEAKSRTHRAISKSPTPTAGSSDTEDNEDHPTHRTTHSTRKQQTRKPPECEPRSTAGKRKPDAKKAPCQKSQQRSGASEPIRGNVREITLSRPPPPTPPPSSHQLEALPRTGPTRAIREPTTAPVDHVDKVITLTRWCVPGVYLQGYHVDKVVRTRSCHATLPEYCKLSFHATPASYMQEELRDAPDSSDAPQLRHRHHLRVMPLSQVMPPSQRVALEHTVPTQATPKPTTGPRGCAEHVDPVVRARSMSDTFIGRWKTFENEKTCDAAQTHRETIAVRKATPLARNQPVLQRQREAMEHTSHNDSTPNPTTGASGCANHVITRGAGVGEGNPEVAHDWCSEEKRTTYTREQFVLYYGTIQGARNWLTAKHATDEATAAVNRIKQDHQFANALTQMLRVTPDDWPSTIFRAFYVPLRWRVDYLQKIQVTCDEWADYDLSAQYTHTWSHVKAFVRTWHWIDDRAYNKHSVESLVINKFSKSTHMAKSIINTGVRSNDWIRNLQRCQSKWDIHRREAEDHSQSRSPPRRHRNQARWSFTAACYQQS